jgi:hypothetical protein
MHNAASKLHDANSHHLVANTMVLQDLKTTLGKYPTMLDYIPITAIHISPQPLIPGTFPYMLDLGIISDTSNRTLTLVAFPTSKSHNNVKDGGVPRVLFFGYGDNGVINDRIPNHMIRSMSARIELG